MRAWRVEKHGGPEVLQRKQMPDPKPRPTEVRVRIEAVGLNHLDLWVQKGVSGHRFPLPMTPGCDISGVIDEVGDPSLSDLKPGLPVIVNPTLSCGRCEACLDGQDPLCEKFGIFGETQDGGCADYVNVPFQNIIPRPKEISAITAAAIQIPYVTAWTMLKKKANVQPGDLVLIQAGGSGVSVAAIQIAKMCGAVVITTVGSEEKVEKAKRLGADHVINYKRSSFREEVKKILPHYGKRGCEIVIDHVGTETFQESLKCLVWGGKLVSCGATSGSQVEIDLKPIFFKNISILGSTMGSKADLIRIVDHVKAGRLSPIVDSTFPMSEAPKAFERLESRKAFGKVVLTAD